MDNQQIARIMAEIADVLEIKEENPFKVRAYQRAAQVIRSLPEELSSLRARGPLTAIAGVGKSTAETIEELEDADRPDRLAPLVDPPLIAGRRHGHAEYSSDGLQAGCARALFGQ